MNYGVEGFGTLLLELGGIVLFLYLVLWFVRRGRGLGGAYRDCTVLRTLPLGPKERLHVVKIGTRQLVVGVGAASVSLICELTEPLAQADGGNAFGDAVKKALGR